MTTLENDILDQSLENAAPRNGQQGYAPASLAENSADVAAELYVINADFRNRFDARVELERGKLRAEAEEALREAQERLAALDGPRPVAKAKPRAKAVAKPAKAAKAKPSSPKAMDLIADAGKEGINTVRLSKMLGGSAGPIVAPLIEAGKVKAKGVKRGTTYFAV